MEHITRSPSNGNTLALNVRICSLSTKKAVKTLRGAYLLLTELINNDLSITLYKNVFHQLNVLFNKKNLRRNVGAC